MKRNACNKSNIMKRGVCMKKEIKPRDYIVHTKFRWLRLTANRCLLRCDNLRCIDPMCFVRLVNLIIPLLLNNPFNLLILG
ncbi:MAG: hypothetical protein JWR87_374 [Segetibacter sp.]|nr:hypothetical protein [Segetibacter sp.]